MIEHDITSYDFYASSDYDAREKKEVVLEPEGPLRFWGVQARSGFKLAFHLSMTAVSVAMVYFFDFEIFYFFAGTHSLKAYSLRRKRRIARDHQLPRAIVEEKHHDLMRAQRHGLRDRSICRGG